MNKILLNMVPRVGDHFNQNYLSADKFPFPAIATDAFSIRLGSANSIRMHGFLTLPDFDIDGLIVNHRCCFVYYFLHPKEEIAILESSKQDRKQFWVLLEEYLTLMEL